MLLPITGIRHLDGHDGRRLGRLRLHFQDSAGWGHSFRVLKDEDPLARQ